ncbi:MAG: hypothetical protein IRZ21_02685 [Thermoleophilaceae bacterium]|nr:hypothetical protein [Thermoleophilaceae bacterium]
MRWRWLASGIVGVAIVLGVVWLAGGAGRLTRAGAQDALRNFHDERASVVARDVRCVRAGSVWRCTFREGRRPCMGSVSGDSSSPAVSYFCAGRPARTGKRPAPALRAST